MLNINDYYANNEIDAFKRQYLTMINDKTFGFRVKPDDLNDILDILKYSKIAFTNYRGLPLSYIKSKNRFYLEIYNEDYFVYITKKGNIHCEIFESYSRKKDIFYKDYNSISRTVREYITKVYNKKKFNRNRKK